VFKYFSIFLFLFFSLFLQAQKQTKEIKRQLYDIHSYTTKDGLSQVSINDIVRDNEGFLWIATQSGLNRFDGTSFYTLKPSDYAKENCGTYINGIIADNNKIWMATRATGLCYYDKKDHTFHSINELRNFNIVDMASDSLNNIYVTLEDKGIGVLKKSYTKNKTSVYILNYFKNKNITTTALYISKTGIIWVGTKKGKLFYGKTKNNPEKIIFNEFDFSGEHEKIFVINSNTPDELWVGTQNNLYNINLLSKKQHNVELNGKSNNMVIYELKWDNNILWIGTGNGLITYNTKSHKVLNRYTHSAQDLNSISNNVIYSIFVDRYKQIWVGTGKFLNLFYKDDTFKKIQHKTGQTETLNSNVIFSILKTKNDLWVGTSGGGINLLRKDKSCYFTKKSHNLPSNICFSLMKDGNNIWAGTKNGIVLINNSSAGFNNISVNTITTNPEDKTSLSTNFIRHICKDNQNNIWLCTSGGGLELFTGDLSENIFTFKHNKHNPFNTNSIASDNVNYIIQTQKNQYWIATDKGVSIMTIDNNTPKKIKFKRLTTTDSVLLDKEVIYTLLKDSQGVIWIGTTKGLYAFQNNKLEFYETKNGLPDNVIYAIIEDFQKNIWMSTNKGLSRFNRKDKTFTNYHKSDGLSSEEYDLHAKFIDSNGIVYFGGIDGITFFDPSKLIYKISDSKLYIDNIQFINPDDNSIKTLFTENNQPVFLKQKQFPVTINFSNINLKYFKNSTFAYRLLPDNERWSIIKEKRFIQLFNLPPNNYILEIREAPKNRVTNNENIIRIPLTVVPLWWQSKWAYSAYLLAIVSFIYLFFRFSLKRKLERQENIRLKDLDKLKSRLYTNITHEFRTPLTVIKGITDEIRNELTITEQKHYDNKLEMIERNSNKLLHLVKQMLDMSKVESGKMKPEMIQNNIIGYLQYVLESFQSMADTKNIKLVFYHETEKIIMDYDQDKFFVITSNLLSNAIKFTPKGGKVIFHVKRETNDKHDVLVMKVQDSGIGIEEKHISHIFDRFYQVDNSTTRKGEGTGIGLALTKELVELLGGKISLKSIPGELTEFCVKIPITNNAPVKKSEIKIFPQTNNDTLSVTSDTKDEADKSMPLALLVEDNVDVAKYIISCIKGKYRVRWSPDGDKGIETAKKHIPDIIISDVMMPVKDGFEVCETLKQNELTSHIPIILLTAKATLNDRIEGLSHGADAYLTKPFNKEELFIRLEQLIKIRRKLQEKYSKTDVNIIKKNKLTLEERFLKKAIEIIKKNIDDPKLNAGLLATGLGMSESQLYRKLKALGRKSTALFIRSIRLSIAKKMLETTDCNVSEAAYSCGFNDPAWFSRAFKNEFGISPGKIKKFQ
jgi:signal transduction histidine kinase/ligand-binding sensor domain-containing protein/CheY-like chemotaxis protein